MSLDNIFIGIISLLIGVQVFTTWLVWHYSFMNARPNVDWSHQLIPFSLSIGLLSFLPVLTLKYLKLSALTTRTAYYHGFAVLLFLLAQVIILIIKLNKDMKELA